MSSRSHFANGCPENFDYGKAKLLSLSENLSMLVSLFITLLLIMSDFGEANIREIFQSYRSKQ